MPVSLALRCFLAHSRGRSAQHMTHDISQAQDLELLGLPYGIDVRDWWTISIPESMGSRLTTEPKHKNVTKKCLFL